MMPFVPDSAEAAPAPASTEPAPGQTGSTAPPGARPGSAAAPPRLSWQRRAGRFLGASIMRVCSNGRRECLNPTCVLQPICACARADLAAARRAEARIWLMIAGCGAAVIGVALYHAHH